MRKSVLGLGVAAGIAAQMALTGAAWANGALAIDSSQGSRYGFSHNYPDQDAADERALQECGANCSVVIQFTNTCAAYATDQDAGSTVYGWSSGASQGAAESGAINECINHGGSACLVRVWACE